MSEMSALRAAQENHLDALRRALDEVARGTATGAAFPAISCCYRRLAICALLRAGDVEQFRVLLARSGQAYAHFLSLVHAGASFDLEHRRTSKAEAFADALAAGDLETARTIATLSSPVHFPDVEYEDAFLRVHVLLRILLDPADRSGIDALLARWEDLSQGSSVFWRATRALHQRDPAAFEQAFDRLLERRAEVLRKWRRMSSHDAGIDATEGKVFMEGLALLRLAELAGLPTRPDYRFLPDLARVPLHLPLPAPGAWRAP